MASNSLLSRSSDMVNGDGSGEIDSGDGSGGAGSGEKLIESPHPRRTSTPTDSGSARSPSTSPLVVGVATNPESDEGSGRVAPDGAGSGEKLTGSPDPRRTSAPTVPGSARPTSTSPLVVGVTTSVTSSPADLVVKTPVNAESSGKEMGNHPPGNRAVVLASPEVVGAIGFPSEGNHSKSVHPEASPACGEEVVVTGKELHQSSIQSPPLLGAWTKKLSFSSSTAYQKPLSVISNLESAKVVFSTETAEDAIRFPWAAKMNPATRNLYRAVEPVFLDDGTPKVTIPPHVLLQGLENQKEYVLGQFFRCSLPPGGLIYAIFNKLWGRNCKITIRKLGASSYLFHIPEDSTRNWVLQRGLWHVDDCLMFVAPWTPEASLAIPEIKTIPVWVTLKNIPSILYSIRGISHIASGLGAPMATHKPRLDPVFMGEAKILVEVELSKAFPPRIAADDKNGVIWMVDVEYAWLPSTCSRCGQLGHKVRRCLHSVSESPAVVEASENVLAATSAIVPEIRSKALDVLSDDVNTVPQSIASTTPLEFPPLGPVRNLNPLPKANSASISQEIKSPVKTHQELELEFPPLPATSATMSYSAVVSQVPTTPMEPLASISLALSPATLPSTSSGLCTSGVGHVVTTTVVQETSTASPKEGPTLQPIFRDTVPIRRTRSTASLRNNRFASLDSSEDDSEEDLFGDLFTKDEGEAPPPSQEPATEISLPSGIRSLRDRPVPQTIKAKEMQYVARGRGKKGRGSRGRGNRDGGWG